MVGHRQNRSGDSRPANASRDAHDLGIRRPVRQRRHPHIASGVDGGPIANRGLRVLLEDRHIHRARHARKAAAQGAIDDRNHRAVTSDDRHSLSDIGARIRSVDDGAIADGAAGLAGEDINRHSARNPRHAAASPRQNVGDEALPGTRLHQQTVDLLRAGEIRARKSVGSVAGEIIPRAPDSQRGHLRIVTHIGQSLLRHDRDAKTEANARSPAPGDPARRHDDPRLVIRNDQHIAACGDHGAIIDEGMGVAGEPKPGDGARATNRPAPACAQASADDAFGGSGVDRHIAHRLDAHPGADLGDDSRIENRHLRADPDARSPTPRRATGDGEAVEVAGGRHHHGLRRVGARGAMCIHASACAYGGARIACHDRHISGEARPDRAANAATNRHGANEVGRGGRHRHAPDLGEDRRDRPLLDEETRRAIARFVHTHRRKLSSAGRVAFLLVVLLRRLDRQRVRPIVGIDACKVSPHIEGVGRPEALDHGQVADARQRGLVHDGNADGGAHARRPANAHGAHEPVQGAVVIGQHRHIAARKEVRPVGDFSQRVARQRIDRDGPCNARIAANAKARHQRIDILRARGLNDGVARHLRTGAMTGAHDLVSAAFPEPCVGGLVQHHHIDACAHARAAAGPEGSGDVEDRRIVLRLDGEGGGPGRGANHRASAYIGLGRIGDDGRAERHAHRDLAARRTRYNDVLDGFGFRRLNRDRARSVHRGVLPDGGHELVGDDGRRRRAANPDLAANRKHAAHIQKRRPIGGFYPDAAGRGPERGVIAHGCGDIQDFHQRREDARDGVGPRRATGHPDVDDIFLAGGGDANGRSVDA